MLIFSSKSNPKVFRRFSERRVVRLLQVTPDFQFGGTLGFDTHATGTEYFLGRSQVELHVREVEFVFAFILESFAVLLPVVVLQGLLQAPFLIFFRRHQNTLWRVILHHDLRTLLFDVFKYFSGQTTVELCDRHCILDRIYQ